MIHRPSASKFRCMAAVFFWATALAADQPAKSFHSAPAAAPFDQSIYVWQEQWSPAVGAALLRARGKTAAFHIYAGRLETGPEGIRWKATAADWPAAAAADRPVVLVVRAADAFISTLPAAAEPSARLLAEEYLSLANQLRSADCTVAGLQLDFDCPTRRLADYRKFIDILKARLGDESMSITALPTWMSSDEFGPLVRAATRFTLQVHGVERPTTIDKPVTLCDYGKIAGWLRRAESFKIPFDVALPTYGYRVIFDQAGKFVALAAEGGGALRSGFRERIVKSDPAELAGFVRSIGDSRSAHLQSIIWFRLPVETDQLNWPWVTLAAAMEGRAPQAIPSADLREPEPGLVELWLSNLGELETDRPIRVPLSTGSVPVARDTLNGFQFKNHAVCGILPPPGETRLVAWFRLDHSKNPDKFELGEIQWLP